MKAHPEALNRAASFDEIAATSDWMANARRSAYTSSGLSGSKGLAFRSKAIARAGSFPWRNKTPFSRTAGLGA